jgi:hypothetical protein
MTFGFGVCTSQKPFPIHKTFLYISLADHVSPFFQQLVCTDIVAVDEDSMSVGRAAISGVIHRHRLDTSFNFTPGFTPGLSPRVFCLVFVCVATHDSP